MPPCENSAGAISSTRAPARRAVSTEPSVDPESHTSSSSSRSTRWAFTAASTSLSSGPPLRIGSATVTRPDIGLVAYGPRERETSPSPAPKGRLADLWRRGRLTLEYHGPAGARVPARHVPAAPDAARRAARARPALRRRGGAGAALVPRAGPPGHGRDPDLRRPGAGRRRPSRASARRPTAGACAVIVVDDGSPPEHQRRACGALRGRARSSCSPRTAASPPPCNRGHRARARRRRRRRAQLRRRRASAAGSSGCSTPAYRDADDRHRRARSCSTPTGGSSRPARTATSARPSGSTTATASRTPRTPRRTSSRPCSARPGACMYIKRAALDEIGALRRGATAWPTRTWTCCLRGWEAGWRTLLRAARDAAAPRVPDAARPSPASASSRPSATSGSAGAPFFDERDVRTAGRPAARRLRHRGHRRRRRPPRHLRAPQPARRARPRRAALLARRRSPTGSRSRSPTRTFEDYDELVARARAELDAIKVATWWNTAPPVWLASVRARHPRLLRPGHRDVVLPRRRRRCGRTCSASYRAGVPLHDDLRAGTATGSRELGLDAALVPPGIDLETFRPLAGRARGATTCCSRSAARNPLKNLPLDDRRLAGARRRRGPELCLFGIEPELGPQHGATLRRAAERRGRQRAVQRGDGVRADLDARGLLPAAAGGDGDRRRGRLHRRPRQPRLLRRRRQLPDARADRRVRVAARSAGCSATRRCASGSARAGIETAARLRLGAADRRARGVPRGRSTPQRSSAIRGAPRG